MKPKKIVFFGTPQPSADILKSLLKIKSHQICAVVTQPDKPIGRQKILTPSPIAQLAFKHQIPLFKPHKLNQSNLEHIKLLHPDIFLVVAFGQIIPADWLTVPSIAALNIHFSLLPKYRGALCVSEAIKNQDKQTGVTLMKIDDQLDHGPIITQVKQTINIIDDVVSLTQKLTQKAITLLQATLPKLDSHTIAKLCQPQDHSKATYTPSYKTRTRTSAFIPFSKLKKALRGTDSTQVHALIRSLNPDPGAWTKINDQELKIIKTKLDQTLPKPKLVIKIVQLPGKNPISWPHFLQGHTPTLRSS